MGGTNGTRGQDGSDPIFTPLKLRTVTVKNRIFRSSIAGRFDNYDGSGNRARINWELKFARGGVGGIITSFVPVHGKGRILPNYARIDSGGNHLASVSNQQPGMPIPTIASTHSRWKRVNSEAEQAPSKHLS